MHTPVLQLEFQCVNSSWDWRSLSFPLWCAARIRSLQRLLVFQLGASSLLLLLHVCSALCCSLPLCTAPLGGSVCSCRPCSSSIPTTCHSGCEPGGGRGWEGCCEASVSGRHRVWGCGLRCAPVLPSVTLRSFTQEGF